MSLLMVGFLVRRGMSARAYRRRLIRSGLPRAHAEALAEDYKGPGLLPLLSQLDSSSKTA